MDTMRLCPQCLEPLPVDSSAQVCPECQSDPGRTTPPGCAGIRPPPPAPAEIAQFFPQLEILELVGHGGMGTIYKARQPQLNRIVALKVLAPELSSNPAFAERFSIEAQSLAKLNHSNIVTVFDFGQTAGFYYFLMEFVDGANLHTLIQDKPLRPAEARRIALEVCQALQFAHDEGVIHRDIKPSNILIDKKGRVKIADFGLAKLTETAEKAADIMGTPHYMAPEQIATPAEVDHRADLYSLGVVFYEMLTGALPLGRFEPPSRKSAASDARLDEVVMRALEKDPDRRYQHASEIRAAIETQTLPVQPPLEKVRQPWKAVRQIALMAGVAMLAVFLYIWVKDRWPSQPAPAPAQFNRIMQAPQVGRHMIAALQLTKTEIPEMNRVIHKYQREFVGLERSHTTHIQDSAGHIHVTIRPFPAEMEKLMTGMWKDLGGVLTPEQLAKARTLNFRRFFPGSGQSAVHMELWRDTSGEEHYIESQDPDTTAAGAAMPIPSRYRSYLPDSH
jgi:tRNA A-37 threonylcarbamoyl transferase component Bud32